MKIILVDIFESSYYRLFSFPFSYFSELYDLLINAYCLIINTLFYNNLAKLFYLENKWMQCRKFSSSLISFKYIFKGILRTNYFQ